MCPCPTGVDDPLRDTFVVKMMQFLPEMEILQQSWATFSGFQRVLVTADPVPHVVGQFGIRTGSVFCQVLIFALRVLCAIFIHKLSPIFFLAHKYLACYKAVAFSILSNFSTHTL